MCDKYLISTEHSIQLPGIEKEARYRLYKMEGWIVDETGIIKIMKNGRKKQIATTPIILTERIVIDKSGYEFIRVKWFSKVLEDKWSDRVILISDLQSRVCLMDLVRYGAGFTDANISHIKQYFADFIMWNGDRLNGQMVKDQCNRSMKEGL